MFEIRLCAYAKTMKYNIDDHLKILLNTMLFFMITLPVEKWKLLGDDGDDGDDDDNQMV